MTEVYFGENSLIFEYEPGTLKVKDELRRHKLAISMLNIIKKKELLRRQYCLKIEIENSKPFIESYLITPKSWYLSQIEKLSCQIETCTKRYHQIFK